MCNMNLSDFGMCWCLIWVFPSVVWIGFFAAKHRKTWKEFICYNDTIGLFASRFFFFLYLAFCFFFTCALCYVAGRCKDSWQKCHKQLTIWGVCIFLLRKMQFILWQWWVIYIYFNLGYYNFKFCFVWLNLQVHCYIG